MNRYVIFKVLLALFMIWSAVPATAQAQTPAQVGQWSMGPLWDIVPINMMVLPSGKVMFYPGNTISADDPRVWDPETNTTTSLAKAGYNIFCSGHSFMRDGSILIPGGEMWPLGSNFYGLPNASSYDPFTNVWTRLPDMNAGRWYPSTTTMGLGQVLVMTGFIDPIQRENPLPQVWEPGTGSWRDLTNALLKIYNYSWVYTTPFGNAIVAGPRQTTRYLNISATGAWTNLATFNFPNVRDYGSSVMYSPYRILIAGGGQPPTNTAEIINLGEPNPTWTYTNPMAFPRRHMNLTLLPDDTVLATGGSSTSAGGFNDMSQPVYAAESWNIYSKAWTTMASQTVGRFYHSTALLLPDGRVLSAGGDFAYQSEIYSPPYLFKGPRPTLTSAPSSIPYTQPFFVETPDVNSIVNVRIIRLPAVTHAFDQNQRILTLKFTKTTGGLNVTSCGNRNQCPPGHYMLFILSTGNIPSVAKIIQLG